MKVLTPISASSGLDVASDAKDNIKLGSINIENNDAFVDNLTVWANADFKNNIILGSSVADNTLVNSKLTASNGLYVSGSLIVNGIEITGSSATTTSGSGISAQEISGALLQYAKTVDVSSSFVDNNELTNSIINFPTRTEVTSGLTSVLSSYDTSTAVNTKITSSLTPYATLIGVSASFARATDISSSFVTNTNATSSLARLAATNTFTANQTITGNLLLNGNINIISSSLGAKYSSTNNEENLYFGSASANSITTGYRNIALGYRSLSRTNTGYQNISIGGDSLFSNSSGTDNIALGVGCLYKNSSGVNNIAIGNASLYSNTAGYNISIGFASLESKVGGSNSVAIGYETLRYATVCSNNTIIGNSSLSSVNLVDSTNNTVVGYNAGNSITSLRNSVIIGGNNGSTINGTTGSIVISDGAGNIRIQANSNGLVTIPGALTVTGILTASNTLAVNSGVKFPATQVASADANTLDDYEEGSWTPAFSASTTTNFSYDAATAGSYVKIGKMVYVNGYININSTGSSAGNLFISQLPFTIASGLNNTHAMTIGWYSILSGTLYAPTGIGVHSTNTIQLYRDVGNGSSQSFRVIDLSSFSKIAFSITYNIS